MADQVLRMTTAHLVRWTALYAVFAAFWAWFAASEASTAMRIIAVALVVLALRGLLVSLLAFRERLTLTLGEDEFVVSTILRPRGVSWADCSSFTPTRALLQGHVRYRVAGHRRSLPAGFGNDQRQLTAQELATILNRAREAALRSHGGGIVDTPAL